MKLIVEIPEKEQLLKEYHIHMNLVDDLKRGTVSDKGFEILYKVLRNGIPLDDIKAEIKLHDDQKHYPYGVIGIRTVLQIIDKHIEERSEDAKDNN